MERKLNIKVLLPEDVIEKYDIDEDTDEDEMPEEEMHDTVCDAPCEQCRHYCRRHGICTRD